MSDSSAVLMRATLLILLWTANIKRNFWQRNERWALDGGDSRGRSRNTWLVVRKQNSLRKKGN